MLRHYYITDHPETMPRAHLIENLHEAVARSCRAKKRPPQVTTKRHEMEIAPPLVALQRIAHDREESHTEEKPAPFKSKGAAPRALHRSTAANSCSGGMLSQCPCVNKNTNRPCPTRLYRQDPLTAAYLTKRLRALKRLAAGKLRPKLPENGK